MTGLPVLDRKLVRDLWRLRTQALAIALVVASGVALLIMALTTVDSLELTTNAYYERYRFADVFANLKRAPDRLADEIAAIPGVQTVETRVSELATLDIAGFNEPVIGRVMSLPAGGDSRLNRIVLRAGRSVADGRSDEAVISEPFAEAHGLKPGDTIGVNLNGQRRNLRIVGIALSPEFVYAIAPGGLMPDDKRYGIIWMGEDALAAAYDMDGAFNDVSLTLLRGADTQAVIERLDRLLDRYGGTGAYARRDQLSNWFLQNEISQQRNMSVILPGIFLVVAAFLTNMVMARLVSTERSEIGLLKAFGYSNLAIGWQYAKLVLAIAFLGIVLGVAVGSWLGHYNTELYARFYRFPFLLYRPSFASYAGAALASVASAMVGSLAAVRRAAMLPPAEAMRPVAPPVFHRSLLARSRLLGWFDEPTRMILRRLLRGPVRTAATAVGIGLSLAVIMMALQWIDAIDRMEQEFFFASQHQDATVGLIEPASDTVVQSFAAMPGVLRVEPFRAVAARIRYGHISRRQAVIGMPRDARLSVVRDVHRGVLRVPESGLLISAKLAETLGVVPGDTVTVEVLEDRRPQLSVRVAGTFESYIDTPVYMALGQLDRLMGEGRRVGGVQLAFDPAQQSRLLAELKDIPAIGAVTLRRTAIASFHDTLAQTIYIFIGFFVVFACTLTFGVVYNTAQIALAERGRDLATLRVLGFRRSEVAYILLGETALLSVLAVPIGIAAGVALAWYLSRAFETELYRIPLTISDSTVGIATVIVLVTAAACAWLVRRRLDHLDLIGVLKTRE